MRKIFRALSLFCLLLVAGCSGTADADGNPEKIVLDYAYYSPTSLVLKEKGWVEEAFKKEGIEVEWVLSQGSNKALEFLNSSSVDFGSSAGAAALMAKEKGSPIESVYLFSKPEWTALVTSDGSSIESIQNLKGKKVAATLGTDPYIFLLRALEANGLKPSDTEIVNLQHGDGAAALLSGQVDAWAGLDPHMARVEIEADASLFYRNADFNTYGSLNVRSEFAEQYPKYVEKVIEQYEKARKWTIENPEAASEILAEEAKIDVEVATKSLTERNDFSHSIPHDEMKNALVEAGKVLQKQKVMDEETNIEELVNKLVNDKYAKKVVDE